MAYLPEDIPSLRSFMSKVLTNNLTSYDLLKAFAVVIMIIDHMGQYFYPDDVWWRVVGRIGFPIWFFLVGYSTGRSIPVMLWGGAILLGVMNYVTGLGMFPLNALVTIILIRLVIDWCMAPVMEGRRSLWALSLVLLLLIIPTYVVTEYGAQALVTAIFGYLVRHRDRLKDQRAVFFYMWFALVSFVVVQQFIFGLDYVQMGVVFVGTLLVRSTLFNFEYQEYPALTATMPTPLVGLLQFMGRHTLEIFIIHLCIFKIATVYLGIQGDWFTWNWLPPE